MVSTQYRHLLAIVTLRSQQWQQERQGERTGEPLAVVRAGALQVEGKQRTVAFLDTGGNSGRSSSTMDLLSRSQILMQDCSRPIRSAGSGAAV